MFTASVKISVLKSLKNNFKQVQIMLLKSRLTPTLTLVFYLVTCLPLIEILLTNTSHGFRRGGHANTRSLYYISQLVKPLVNFILPYFTDCNSLIFQTKRLLMLISMHLNGIF